MAKTISTVLKLKDQFSSPLKNCASACQAYSGKAKTSSKDTQNLGSALKSNLAKSAKIAGAAVAAAATAAAAAGAKMAQETMQQADTVDKMSQKIGISRKAYQELDFITSQCGASIGNMKMGMKTLTGQMQSAAQGSQSSIDAFDALGVSIYDSSGKLRSQEDMMWDAFSALQGMTNQTEKAAIANQIFGRAGSELMPMLNGSAGSIEKMREKAEELGLVMSDDTVDAGVKLTDTMDQIKRALSAVAMRIGAKLLPYAQKAGDYLLDHLPQIESAAQKAGTLINKMGDAVKWVYDKSSILIPILSGAVAGIAAFKVISTITALIGAWKAVTAAYAATQGVANMTMLACPLTWIVVGIAAVVAIGIALYKNWDTICAWAKELKEKILNLKTPFGTLGEVIDSIKRKFQKVKDAITSAYDKVKAFFGLGDSGGNINVNVNGADQKTPTTKHATGTSYFKGGYTGYSEGGRQESAIFPSGTKIIPAAETKKQEDRGQGVTVYVTVQGNMIGNETAMRQFAEYTGREILSAMGNV